MTIWQILLDPWRAQRALALMGVFNREADASFSELTKLRAEMADAERELESLESELAWLQDGPGVKRMKGGYVVRHFPLNVQPVWPTLREAIRYGMESE